MSDSLKTAISIVFLFLGLPVALLLTSDWLRQRQLTRRYPNREKVTNVFQLPYRISFTSTREDLVCAFENERIAATGLGRMVRWCLVGVGCAFLLGPVAFWEKANPWQLAIWMVLGIAILWSNVIEAFLKRRHIRATASASQELVLEFRAEGIHIEAQGVGMFDRAWNELDGANNFDEGVLVCFTDGTENWLPRRVFPNEATKTALYTYLQQRLFDTEMEEDSEA